MLESRLPSDARCRTADSSAWTGTASGIAQSRMVTLYPYKYINVQDAPRSVVELFAQYFSGLERSFCVRGDSGRVGGAIDMFT
jgi:hypothetical protein